MVIKPLFGAAFCVSCELARLQPNQKNDISAKTAIFA